MKFLAGDEKRFFEFIGNLNEKDRIAVISHTDGDGVCSAIIASVVIGKPDFVGFHDYTPGHLKELIKEMKKKKINKSIFLDLNLTADEAKEISNFSEVLLIDHHPFQEDANSDRIVFIKADCGSACFVSYYLFSKIQQVPSWIPALGTLSDTSPWKYNESNLDEFYSDFGFRKIDRLWEKTLDLSYALIYLRGKTLEVYNRLMSAKKFSELGIEEQAKIVRKEFDNQLANFEKKKEIHGDMVYYYFSPKYDVKSLMVNKISTENPGNLIVMVQDLKHEKYLKISSRCQNGKVDCNIFMKQVVSGIPSSNAGGHFKAAAGRIPREYLAKFKENLLSEYKKLK